VPSVIKINAGEFAAAVKFASGKINKKRKTPFPLLLEEQDSGKLTVTDAAFHKKGMAVSFDGIFDDSAEVDARQLLKITSTYHDDAELVVCVDDGNFIIQYQKSKLSIPRLDKGGKKTKKKALPHKKPPTPEPEPLEKRAEFDHSWGFSARVPMPAEAVKKDKD
jgi:hypothetical protein